jgi:putative endonuclease
LVEQLIRNEQVVGSIPTVGSIFFMSGHLYILKSLKTNRFYIGSAVDPARRLHEHNSGYVTATRNKDPWEQIILICFPDKSTARIAEYYLKKQNSRQSIEDVISGSFKWPDGIQPAG